MYIDESFYSNFNMDFFLGGGGVQRPFQRVVGRKNHLWTRGLSIAKTRNIFIA